ncbi:MAG: hypothetical protein HYZ32_02095 [Hydrocarboniphaga effusa]|nr:hypothetical protein [Hydrocarboniphaga effusa]
MIMEDSGFYVAALIACGMGGAVWITDRKNPSSRALALLLVATALAIVANVVTGSQFGHGRPPLWTRGIGFLECLAFLAGTEWGLRVGRTVVAPKLFSRGVWLMRTAQALSLVYAALAAAFPELREREFVNALQPGVVPGAIFFLFAGPPLLAGALVLIAGFSVLRSRPDKAEARRILTTLAAMPLLTVAVVLPDQIAPMALAP